MPGALPLLGLAYRVTRVTTIIELECQQCDGHATVTLINQQPARCPRCGAEYDCGGIRTGIAVAPGGTPEVAISAGPPTKPAN